MEQKIYDSIIIGAGPAGMTAAIYLGRANKTVALIDKEGFGGNIAKSPFVENIPGFLKISGIDFATKMYKQVLHLSTVTNVINTVIQFDYNYKNKLFEVRCADQTIILGKTVIIATGTEHKTLHLPTKDIYYCATCDGAFFKGQPVLVVGSGNTGATYALELAEYCSHVDICDITQDLNCEATLKAKILMNKKISWWPASSVSAVKTIDGKLASVALLQKDSSKEIDSKAIFAAIGMKPSSTYIFPYLLLDQQGFIIPANNSLATSTPGCFIAGDCVSKTVRQVTTAVNDGTISAHSVLDYLRNL